MVKDHTPLTPSALESSLIIKSALPLIGNYQMLTGVQRERERESHHSWALNK